MNNTHRRFSLKNLPPWLWFWLVAYALSLPYVLGMIREGLVGLFAPAEASSEIVGGLPLLVELAVRLASVAGIVPPLALLLGVLTVFVPWLRARYLEKRYRLTEQLPPAGAAAEIAGFLRAHAPGLRLRGNLLRTDQLAFVYPLGYRKTAMAVFGGLLKLWRSDRKAAEAVLLHEAAHYRNGDALMVGAGSLFEAVVRYSLLAYLIFLFVPQTLQIVAQRITAVEEMFALEVVPLPSIALFTIGQIVFGLALVSLQAATWALFAAGIFLLPLLAIWLAEFNADRFAAGTLGTGNVLGALAKMPRPVSRWRWLLARLSHPPDGLRRWAASRSWTSGGTVVLLLLFPLAYLLRLLIQSTWAIVTMAASFFEPGEIARQMMVNVGYALQNYERLWIFMALLIALWPFVTRPWQRLFSDDKSDEETEAITSSGPSYAAYLLCAAIVVGLSGSSYLLRLIISQ